MNRPCMYCKGSTDKGELCRKCYRLYMKDYLWRTRKNTYVINEEYENPEYFYKEDQSYYKTEKYLNERELKFYNIISKNLDKKYILIPQVNLQSIVNVTSKNRHNELFRNIDFVLFTREKMEPFLAIEINGKNHYNDDHQILRDKSVQRILYEAQIPLIKFTNLDIETLDEELSKILNRVINLCTPLNNKEFQPINPKWLRQIINDEKGDY